MENFPNNLSDVVQYEVEQEFTRAEVTFASGSKFKLGDVVELGADGKAVIVATAANASGIVVSDEVDATNGDAKGAIIARGPAIVSSQFLNYNDKAAADVDAALLAKNILVVKPAV
ncbi:MAG: head decoration protein [Clostridium sp.]|nr:head decoration protein [Clostridium sp.]